MSATLLPRRPCERHFAFECELCSPQDAHPFADAHDLLEARCAELERECRTAHAEGFLYGRLEAAALVREWAQRPGMTAYATDLLERVERAIRGDE